jgi:hypothetical protein
MITTKREWSIFRELVTVLEEDIKALGPCDHSVNLCICGLVSLRQQAQWVLDKHKAWSWLDRTTAIPKRKETTR